MNVLEYLTKLRSVRDKIQDETERIIYKNEKEIIQLNTKQIDDSIGADDKLLNNKDKSFKGVYSLATQMINPLKIAGDPYNFTDTGNFFRGFYVEVLPNLTQIEIGSTGTGLGDKDIFFRGYSNIFGLTSQNQYKLNYEIILPELQKFIQQQIG